MRSSAAEDVSPFGEAAVRGQDHGALFIAGVDELKEQVAATWGDRQVADFVDDQQRTTAQEADFLTQGAFAFGFGEGGDEIGKRDEVDALAGADGLDCQCGGEMGFAGAGRSSVILPGVRRLRFGFSIRFTRAAARRSLSSTRSATLAPSISSSANQIGRWRCCQRSGNVGLAQAASGCRRGGGAVPLGGAEPAAGQGAAVG